MQNFFSSKLVFQGAKYVSLHSFEDSNARSFLMPTQIYNSGCLDKVFMSFYNLVENAEVYGYPRGGEPLKNNHLTEKSLKEKWMKTVKRKKTDRNDRIEQSKRAHSFYYNNRQVHLNKKASDFKSKILRMYL